MRFQLFKYLWRAFSILFALSFITSNQVHALKHYTKDRKLELREQVRSMFQHAYEGYLRYASEYDELRPLTCDGIDTWGSYSLTLIDALDTLATMGNYTEFRRVVKLLEQKMNFDKDINVSVFETNIRIVGGLLSAHMFSKIAGVELESGWPCQGPLLRLAEDVAKRLLPAFDTATGMPYGTVNLRYGVPKGETSITCTAGVGTLLVEFGTLSRLTGNGIYEEVALNALHSLWQRRSSIGLFGNHIDVQSGRWTALDSGIGAGVDSLFEYMAKGAILLQRPELLEMFHAARAAIDKYLRHDDWYVWAGMNKGQVTLPVFQSLEAFWPGVLSLIGEREAAIKTIANYASVWRKYGFLPEFYNIPTGDASPNRESYPLRPELVESAMYLYRATKNEFLLEMGESMLMTIEHSAKTKCGYATIRNVVTHEKENRMESFFLAETTKYLYLLFDEDNFLHNNAGRGEIIQTPHGGECVINTGPYIFNTEAHPVDMSALFCCHDNKQNIFDGLDLHQFSDSVLAKTDYELNIKDKSDLNLHCSRKQTTREKASKITVHPPPSKAASQPSLAVDIEVFDDDNKPVGDILVESFERVKNEQVTGKNQAPISNSTSTHRNQLTISDLLEFFSKKRNSFKNSQDCLEYTVNFMKNFTLDRNLISGLQLYDPNIREYLGSGTQIEFEKNTKTMWELYELLQRFQMNINLLIAFNMQTFRNLDPTLVDKVLAVLEGDQSDTSSSFIWNKMNDIYMTYARSLANTTSMQNLLLKVLINGSEEKQKSYKAFLTDDVIASLTIEAVDVQEQVELFAYAKTIVETKKRMLETYEQLQKLLVDINSKETSDKAVMESTTSTEPPTTDSKHTSNTDDLIVASNINANLTTLVNTSSNTFSANNTTVLSSSSSSLPSPSSSSPSLSPSPSTMTGPTLMHSPLADRDNVSGISVWSQLVYTFLGKSAPQKSKFDASELLQRTRKSLEKYADIPLRYDLLTCARPKFLESFAYRYYYP